MNIKDRLHCDEECCLCGKHITALTDLYDPFPLEKSEEKYCCRTCFREEVVKARINIVQKKLGKDTTKDTKESTLEE